MALLRQSVEFVVVTLGTPGVSIRFANPSMRLEKFHGK
jgi:hypothetical protein